MPQTDFFLDNVDEQYPVSLLLSYGGTLVPNYNYAVAEYDIVRSLSAFAEWRLRASSFLIVFDQFVRSPLRMEQIGAGYYAGKFALLQRRGGPSLYFDCSIERSKDVECSIVDGGIGYYPTYRNTITDEMEPTPDVLIQLYKEVVRRLKRHCKLVKGQQRKYLIGPHTYDRAKCGELKLGVPGLVVP